MAEVVNLRTAKKSLTRAKKRASGNENAQQFGRTKAQKTLEKAQAQKSAAALDAHRREPE